VTGIVYLVGAGPGDPRLMTLRGAEVLRQADVVVYDRLAAPALLDLAPGRAERIYAGKEPGASTLEQEEINELLVSRGRAGSVVVRLKGGDPFVFGRGGEEALACAEAGVPFEVVPGVSSATAVPAYAGIPLTHRGTASSFAVVTASTAPGREVDLQRVSSAVDTLVVLMAAGKLEQVCTALIAGGRSPDEPAAVIEGGTTLDQRSIVAPLARLPSRAAWHGVQSPAALVVGTVVELSELLRWFTPDLLAVEEKARDTPEAGNGSRLTS
jgi:uroporphyrinogen III methyltransferase / synthase